MSGARPRFVFITGGVVSSLGKGLSAAALGALLQAHGYRVRLRKLDPYLNVDAGTMSPYQHGEVFVTDDGAETDLDLGHYERFTGIEARRSDNVTSGRVYERVLARERRGDYLGGTVQVIPHVTDTIKDFIRADTDHDDFVLVEIGGTVGDIEGLPFLEAIRQFGIEVGRPRVLYLHLTLIPYLEAVGEQKTKPTQHSVKELRGIGIQPDLLLCRCDRPIPEAERAKLALFCNVDPDSVVPAIDADTVYEVPEIYRREQLDRKVLRYFGLPGAVLPVLDRWRRVVEAIRLPAGHVDIAVVGKYTGLPDAYKSLIEALVHSGAAHRVGIRIRWLDAERLERARPEDEALTLLQQAHGILVPGGFGDRGVAGKIRAIEFARTRKVPYFGICLGLQLAVIEVARALAGLRGAGSTEFGTCAEPVVGLLTEWACAGGGQAVRNRDDDLGGTMRLGGYDCLIDPGSRALEIYGMQRIRERHRHRYEVNPAYESRLRTAGLRFSGKSPDGALFEIAELGDHPWFLGVQFHPELRSRPFAPHPLFTSFVEAAIRQERLL